MSYSKKTMIWSMCAALCIVLPQAVRVIPNADIVYKAMQVPVLLCGILCGSGSGLMCALTGVCISALISGVPTLPMFPVVLIELALIGLISGATVKIIGTVRGESTVVFSVVFALLLGRIAAGVAAAMLFSPGHESMALWIWAYVIAGLPSFIVQLILVPAIIKALEYSGLVYMADRPEPTTQADNRS